MHEGYERKAEGWKTCVITAEHTRNFNRETKTQFHVVAERCGKTTVNASKTIAKLTGYAGRTNSKSTSKIVSYIQAFTCNVCVHGNQEQRRIYCARQNECQVNWAVQLAETTQKDDAMSPRKRDNVVVFLAEINVRQIMVFSQRRRKDRSSWRRRFFTITWLMVDTKHYVCEVMSREFLQRQPYFPWFLWVEQTQVVVCSMMRVSDLKMISSREIQILSFLLNMLVNI